jgi:hypothetical protein
MVLFLTAASGRAETIYLKDGGVVKGEIVSRGSYHIIVMEGHMPRRYYNEQILRIEEDEGGKHELGGVAIDPSKFEGISPEKTELILTLIEVNGVRKSIQENMEKTIRQAPAGYQTQLEQLFDVNEIIQYLVPIYDKYYSMEELKNIIDFFRSPAGQKVIEVTPKIVQETMQASVEFFEKRVNP